jgi:transketolase
VFVGSDLGVGTLQKMKDEMPDRFFIEGVSEQNIVGLAAGLALEGRVVYVNTIATFITRRAFEQIALDLCLHDVDVRLIGNGGGVVYAPLGPTHQAIEDIAIFRALPRMTVIAVADAEEMRRMMPCTLERKGPIYIRLGKGGDPVVTDGAVPFEIGKAFPMREGGDALIVSTGICLKHALEAADVLAGEGTQAAVLHVPTVKPLDAETLVGLARAVRAIVSVEEHTIMGGLGSAVAEAIAEAGFEEAKRFARIGIPDVFPEKYGNQQSLMAYYGISTEGVAGAVRRLLGKGPGV